MSTQGHGRGNQGMVSFWGKDLYLVCHDQQLHARTWNLLSNINLWDPWGPSGQLKPLFSPDEVLWSSPLIRAQLPWSSYCAHTQPFLNSSYLVLVTYTLNACWHFFFSFWKILLVLTKSDCAFWNLCSKAVTRSAQHRQCNIQMRNRQDHAKWNFKFSLLRC